MTSTLSSQPAWAPAPCSRVGFGGAAIGLSDYLADYDATSIRARTTAIAAVQAAHDAGITYFDTAPGYGDGLSEALIGEALDGAAGVTIATKTAALTRDDLMRSVEASLRRLRRSRIDLLQLHGTSLSPETARGILAPGGLADAVDALRDTGIVGAVGFTSEDNNSAVYDLIGSGRFDAVQLAYNLLLQHPWEPTRPFGSLLEARRKGMFTVTMRTATSGVFQRWMRLQRPDDDFDYAPALIQFVLSNPLVDVALVGMRTPEEARSTAAIWRDIDRRIDIPSLWTRYVTRPETGEAPDGDH